MISGKATKKTALKAKKSSKNAAVPKKRKALPSVREEYEGSGSDLENEDIERTPPTRRSDRKSIVSVGYADEDSEQEMERVVPDAKIIVKSVSVEEEEEESDKQDDEDMVEEEEEEEPILKRSREEVEDVIPDSPDISRPKRLKL
jgi:hypothetical protein